MIQPLRVTRYRMNTKIGKKMTTTMITKLMKVMKMKNESDEEMKIAIHYYVLNIVLIAL